MSQRNPFSKDHHSTIHRLSPDQEYRARRILGRPVSPDDYRGVHTTDHVEIAAAYAMATWTHLRDHDEYPVIIAFDVTGRKPLPDIDALIQGADLFAGQYSTVHDLIAEGKDVYEIEDWMHEWSGDGTNPVGEDPAALIFEGLIGTNAVAALVGAADDPEEALEEWMRTGEVPPKALSRVVGQQRYLDDFGVDRVVSVDALKPWWHKVLDEYYEMETIEELEERGWQVFGIDDVDHWPLTFKNLYKEPSIGARIEYHGTTSQAVRAAFPDLDIPDARPFPVEGFE